MDLAWVILASRATAKTIVEIGATGKMGRQRTLIACRPSPCCFIVGGNSLCLFFVAVEAVDGSDGAKEAVLLTVNAGGEKQSVGWSSPVFRGSGVAIVAEGERPKSVDGEDGIVGILHEAQELVREAVERGDAAATEIADENGIAELAEIASGPYDAPGRVEPRAMLEVPDVLAGSREDFNETETVAGHVVVAGSVLLRIGDEKRAADVLDIERREAARDALPTAVVMAVTLIAIWIERVFTKLNALESHVVDFHFSGTEIRDVEEAVSIDFTARHAFIDGAIRGTVIGIVNDEDGVLSAIPAGDRSI